MKHTIKPQRYSSFFMILMGVLAGHILSAQIRNPQVEVRRIYEGEIRDANPLLFRLPVHDSLRIVRQEVTYSNPVSPMETYMLDRIIPPAGIVSHTGAEYKEFLYLRAGLAYPFTPMADLYMHAPLPSGVSLNFYLSHRSFWGHTLLFDNAPDSYTGPSKIRSDYMNNDVGLSFRKTWRRNTLTVQGEYKGRAALLHGNDTLLLHDAAYAARLADHSFVKDYFAQAHHIVTGEARFRSNSDEGLVYNVGFWADYVKDKMNSVLTGTPMSQTMLGADGYWGYWFKTTTALYLDYGASLLNKYNISGFSDISFRITPNFRYAAGKWDVKIGAGIDFLTTSEYNFSSASRIRKPKEIKVYPAIYAAYKLHEELATAYFKMDGKTHMNNYSAIALENPYILPGWCLDHTYERFTMTAGLRGGLPKVLNYHAYVSYGMVDDMHFYMNSRRPVVGDTAVLLTTALRHNFEIATDSTTACFTAGLELDLIWRKLELNARVQYHAYGLNNLEKAWHKPAFELGLNGRYTWKRWMLSMGGYVRGSVPVLIDRSNPLSSLADGFVEAEIKSYFDLSFMAEYRWKNWLSFFLQGSDLLNTRYQDYYLYYTQGRTVHGGISLKF